MLNPFYKVNVYLWTPSKTLIKWDIDPRFADNFPWQFTVQYSEHGLSQPQWIDVGNTTNIYFWDNTQRWFGKTKSVYYRIKLQTPTNIYFSNSVPAYGELTRREWLLVGEILRKEKLRYKSFVGIRSYLFKQKRSGQKCTRCFSKTLNQSTDSQCPICFGTNFVGGYFGPEEIFFEILKQTKRRELIMDKPHQEASPGGTARIDLPLARIVGFPIIETRDLLVTASPGQRYQIHTIINISTYRSVPISYIAEIKPIPPNDVVYSLEIPPPEL